MKKAVIGLITFALIAMNGSALAWDVDVTISVEDASVDLTATATTDDYILGTAAGIEGTGQIGVHGEGDNESGHLITGVSGAGRLYASQALGSAGCLVDCVEEQCDNCPEYQYGAASYATINGAGAIILTQAAGYDTQNGNVTGQILIVRGVGDFTAGMMSSLWIEGMEESVIHTMGAYGLGVEFCVFGIHGMNPDDGENGGYFTANMNFFDEGCEGDECPEPEPE